VIEHGDGLPDDRVLCEDCRRYRVFYCEALKTSALPDVPLRCMQFIPVERLRDSRPGSERWPTLKQDIEELREMDRAHHAALKSGTH
jgi:hypothetical protein